MALRKRKWCSLPKWSMQHAVSLQEKWSRGREGKGKEPRPISRPIMVFVSISFHQLPSLTSFLKGFNLFTSLLIAISYFTYRMHRTRACVCVQRQSPSMLPYPYYWCLSHCPVYFSQGIAICLPCSRSISAPVQTGRCMSCPSQPRVRDVFLVECRESEIRKGICPRVRHRLWSIPGRVVSSCGGTHHYFLAYKQGSAIATSRD